jgi:hypothetical protein
MSGRTWLPPDFRVPDRVEVPRAGHLRFLRAADAVIDYAAIDRSRADLWATYQEVWGWPNAAYSLADTRGSLARHEAASLRGDFFAYGLFDADETRILGTVYIDPASRAGADADINWWVTSGPGASSTTSALEGFLPGWVGGHWPFSAPRLIGRDLSWQEWLSLPQVP